MTFWKNSDVTQPSCFCVFLLALLGFLDAVAVVRLDLVPLHLLLLHLPLLLFILVLIQNLCAVLPPLLLLLLVLFLVVFLRPLADLYILIFPHFLVHCPALGPLLHFLLFPLFPTYHLVHYRNFPFPAHYYW